MPPLSWAAAWRSKTAGLPCGDRHLVRRAGGMIMIAVIDGSGSGARAAAAATSCHAALSAVQNPNRIEECFAAAHQACRDTCGVALGLALIEPSLSKLTWGAVGDIDGLLIRQTPLGRSRRESMLQCGGTVGVHLPPMLSQTHQIGPSDLVILVSDGIRGSYRSWAAPTLPVTAIAANVLKSHGRADDDAMVLAVRMGRPS